MSGWYPEKECLPEDWKIEWSDEKLKARDFPKPLETTDTTDDNIIPVTTT